jgi:hypothetical protein
MIEMSFRCKCGRGMDIWLTKKDFLVLPKGIICNCGVTTNGMPGEDNCPHCGKAQWRYDIAHGWVRTCCAGAAPSARVAATCPLCQTTPHKEDCGLWSPYGRTSA